MIKIIVKKLDVVQMDVGAPIPTILSDEFRVMLLYYINIPDPKWDGTYVNVRSENDTGIAVITFDQYLEYKAGGPNDEAASGHRYYIYGVKPYYFYEILNSEWVKELEKMNRVHPQHRKEMFYDYRHIIGFFHDSCFEILSKTYNIELYKNKTMKDVILEKVNKLNE